MPRIPGGSQRRNTIVMYAHQHTTLGSDNAAASKGLGNGRGSASGPAYGRADGGDSSDTLCSWPQVLNSVNAAADRVGSRFSGPSPFRPTAPLPVGRYILWQGFSWKGAFAWPQGFR